MALNYLTTEAAAPANAAIIWMHGLGATGYDFYTANLPEQLNLPNSIAIRFIFPHAPLRPVTINNGYTMPAWYDIHGLDRESREDEVGLKETEARIAELIEEQIRLGISANRIILAGFSQGGAVALYCALRYPRSLGGVIALSTYLPGSKSLATEANPANAALPIFMAHGSLDETVILEWGEASRDTLETLGYTVDWHVYPMAHQLCAEELVDMRGWLLRVLN